MKRMGILGPRGTHSEAAAVWRNAHVDEPMQLIIRPDIYDVLHEVESGSLDAGFVPVENSLEGSINITLDTLARSDNLIVTREIVWPVHNQLMTLPDVHSSDIKKIFSHAQPISQCRSYILKHFPSAEVQTTPSTARAAEIVAASSVDEGLAAICTRRAGEINGLVTLATEIQDNMSNSTRFFEIRRAVEPIDPIELIEQNVDADKVMLICQLDGSRPGALYDVLGEFAFRNVNMTRIESRPARTTLGEYIFFFDLDTNARPGRLVDSIDAVGRKVIWIKNIGAFPVLVAAVD